MFVPASSLELNDQTAAVLPNTFSWITLISYKGILLSSTPLFNDFKFDRDAIITSGDLGEFVELSKRLSSVVEMQLGITTRNDVETKPITQLGKLLKMVCSR